MSLTAAHPDFSTEEVSMLRVRIQQIDYTLVQPGILDLDNLNLDRVPIIRIYGASSAGVNTCVHVHQVYPYFFIEYTGTLNPYDVERYIHKLTHSLNHAIAISLKRKPGASGFHYIRAAILVKGLHFYGFHERYSPFIKIFIADPTYISRAATILQSGTVMSTRFRVFESHLSFLLQFMSDFGLYGCGWINLRDPLRRGGDEDGPNSDEYNSTLKPSSYFRQSRMPLEVDIVAPQILNRYDLVARDLFPKPGIQEAASHVGPLIPSIRELWDDERQRRLGKGLDPSPEIPIDPSEASRKPRGEWVSEARWWEEVERRIVHERESIVAPPRELQGWEEWTMSAFESIEVLWDENWKTWKPIKTGASDLGAEDPRMPFSENTSNGVDVEIDVSLLSFDELNQLEAEEKLEWDTILEEDQRVAEADESDHSDDMADADDIGEHSETDLSPHLRSVVLPNIGTAKCLLRLSPTNPFMVEVEKSSNETEFKLPSPPPFAGEHQLEVPQTPTRNNNAKKAHSNQNQQLPYAVRAPRLSGAIYQHLPETSELEAQREASGSNPTLSNIRPRSIPLVSRTSRFKKNPNGYRYVAPPPSTSDLLGNTDEMGLEHRVYRLPYFSKEVDLPEKPREYAGLIYHLKGEEDLPSWETNLYSVESDFNTGRPSHTRGGYEYADAPPSFRLVNKWLKPAEGQVHTASPSTTTSRSQIKAPTQPNIYGVDTPEHRPLNTSREKRAMSILSLEIFVLDREIDGIVAAFYCYQGLDSESRSGAIIIKSAQFYPERLRHFHVDFVSDELDLINKFMDIVVELDPDILIGWDVQRASWGFLDARGQHYGFDISDMISRAPHRKSRSNSNWDARHTSTLYIAGRHVLNLWRIMRTELALNSYTLENVVFNVLRQRVPHYSPATLTEWYYSPVTAHVVHVLQYFFKRTSITLQLLEEAEIITKTAEFARVFGVDFFSVLNRGSQFKVESFLFRIAKPESFLLISPSRADVGKQNAAECMPLTMEPTSAFYPGPLVVLDFQSLYPSIMIAYNYCYSTCLGRAVDFQGGNKLGVVQLDNPPGLLESLREHIFVAPNGIMYVKPATRKGLLGRMLSELLDTRVMVKQAMKNAAYDKGIKRILNARQLGLKFICNVTYGYTGATFSGRMPAVEIADSIVQTGRETLEKAITTINTTEKWGAKVVYGDTDSLFIYLPGKTKEQAFRIGNEMANAITVSNPPPVKLKFEKVYLPCVLIAKKRYVGFKYENVDDSEPVFDAKGIETVRRDGIPAQKKMTENCLKILFRNQDLSEVKNYCLRSWATILGNKAPNIQDFTFSKEVRMGTYSPPPPGATVAARRMIVDPNDEPQYKERVPYVITRGATAKLVDRAFHPLDVINNRLDLDAIYYISRVLIPPLERIFNLVGADVRQWFADMPKTRSNEPGSPTKDRGNRGAEIFQDLERLDIQEHFSYGQCLVCGSTARQGELAADPFAPHQPIAGICDECCADDQTSMTSLSFASHNSEKHLNDAHKICAACTGTSPAEPIRCESIDCAWFYSRKRAEIRMEFLDLRQMILDELNSNSVV
ncbi:hypothetical protein BD779DRAFT_1485278 [Infundibulicybe gibba]|nr:hypothetical protein BD779DRAFT_1485278 [Infundibulicybe gibba]